MSMRGRRDQRRNNNQNNMNYRGGSRGGRGGSFGQRPSYRDNQRNAPFKNAPNMNRMQQQQPSQQPSVNRKRGKPSELQLDRYQNAADRDVLCWIYENQGKCRYGERCQWLHLDRETGQYIPTVYIMNSLSDKNMVCKPVNDDDDKDKEQEKEREEEKAQEEEATPKGKKEDEQDDDDDADDDVDPVVLQKKFMLLMQEGIKKKAEEEEKKKLIETEENKMQKEEKKKKGKEEQEEDNKEEEEAGNDETICKEVSTSKYGAYGTTFDRQNVCWEFNTFVGCRKGSKCKWAHQYLVKESAHPYTGEKLNGMAVRKFRVSNNI